MANITGTSGNDELAGTSGSDKINSAGGADTLIYNLTANSGGTKDVYTGGAGIDTLVLELSYQQWNTLAVQNEITRYTTALLGMKKNAGGEVAKGGGNDFTFTFGSSTLTVQMVEALRVKVKIDGVYVEMNLTDEAVAAQNDTAAASAGVTTTLSVLHNDSVPDLVSSLALVPASGAGTALTYGTVQLVQPDLANASTWYFTYVLDATDSDYIALGKNVTAIDSFTYKVTDADGDFATASVLVTVKGVNDPAAILDANNDGKNDFAGVVTESAGDNAGTAEARGTLFVTDPDSGENKLYAISSPELTSYGSYTVNASGEWIYTLDNSKKAVDDLTGVDTLTDTFTVFSADASTYQTITITIKGADDPLIANPDELWVTSHTWVTLSTGILLKNDIGGAPENLFVKSMTAGAGITDLILNQDGTFSFGTVTNGGPVEAPVAYTFSYTLGNAATLQETESSVTVKVVAIDPNGSNTVDLSGRMYDGAYLAGGTGIDHLMAGSGDTVMLVGSATDNPTGNTGIDTVIAPFSIYESNLNPYLYVENFTITGTAATYLAGNDGDNILTGNDFANFLNGLLGVDTLYGMGGDDNLDGGAGNDVLFGGEGNDLFRDLLGNNSMTGGTGADQFTLNENRMNTVCDFSSAEGDKLLIGSFYGAAGGVFDFSTSATAVGTQTGKFLYNTTRGELYFGQSQIALIGTGDGSAHPTLTADSFTLWTA